MQFNVLGVLTIRSDGEALNPGGVKQRTVLAMFIAAAGREVSADTLIEAVYGENATPGARRTIQTYVSNLRSVVGDTIQKAPGGWLISVPRSSVDALHFEDLYRSMRDLEPVGSEHAAAGLQEAMGLWRGHPYVDVEAHGYLDAEISRLNELRSAASAARIDADLALGRHAELIGEIDALLIEHPFEERFRAQHMLALYRSGRQKAALRSFASMRELLVEELGIDPTPELQELEQRILEQDETLNLPPPTTIQKRAVLVVTAGDPIELARFTSTARDDLLRQSAERVEAASKAESAERIDLAGTAFYAQFESPAQATAAAEAIALSPEGEHLRAAVDWGDVEVSKVSVSGPPIARAARLVAASHRGQVLISPHAQQAMTGPSGRTGMRLEALGEYELPGLEGRTFLYQLLVGSPPREFPELATDRVPPPLPGIARRGIPGYELHEQLGYGSVGPVYRGYQASVGREVVAEVIGRVESSDVGFIRRFEADVQRLSLLEHPNILPVLDYWRDTEGSFIIYPFHRGGSLDGSIGEVDAGEIAHQVASAVGYAHSYGLVHGRLSPNRILLDEGGHPYLYGFPVAGVTAHDPESSAYMAPEALDGDPSVAGDIFALGMLAYTLLTGAEPDPDAALDLSLLDARTRTVIAKATAIDPADRQASTQEFLADLSPVEGIPTSDRYTETRNPYKGLAAFQESDAGDFYGRTAVVEELIEILAVQDFLAVVGPSGIGKSSVVRAGLIPALRRGAVEGSENWLITDMLPGSHPFRDLERSLERVSVELPIELREHLANEGTEAFPHLKSALPADARILLVVDQFEELFTMADVATTERFLRLLLEAVDDDRVSIVVTLRADFLGRPLQYSDFGELLRTGVATVRSPTSDELKEAITRPAGSVGVTFEPALTERIVATVHDQPGALPLLQHTLAELFRARSGDVITIADYEAVGGIHGSLARRAEAIYEDLNLPDRELAKQLFLSLVAVEDGGRPSRRRVRVSSLEHLDAAHIADAFTERRLLVHDRDPATRTPTLEVAHEALFTHWPRLAGWVANLREDLVLKRRLTESVEEWEENDRDNAYLLTPVRLAQHQEWTAQTELTLTDTERTYLQLSKSWQDNRAAAQRRRRRSIMAGFAAAAIIAAGFGIAALINASRADEQAELARQSEAVAIENAALAHSRELAAAAIKVLDEDPELSVLLALEAASDADPTFESVAALHEALQSHRTVGTVTWPEEWPVFPGVIASMSPDGSLLAVSGALHQLAVWDLESDSEVPIWSVEMLSPEYATIIPHFTSDGERVVATVSWFNLNEPAEQWPEPPPETGVYVWNARSGEVIQHHRGTHCPPLTLLESSGRYIDDQQLVGVGVPSANDCAFNGAVDIWLMDLSTGEMTLGYEYAVFSYPWGTSASFSADGRYFSYADGASTSSVVDLQTGERYLDVPGGEASQLTRDGMRLLAASKNSVSFWNLDTRTQQWESDSPVRLAQVFLNEDAGLVYSGTENGSVRVWDVETGRLLFVLKGHQRPTWFVSGTADGTMVASSSTERAVRLWDLTANAQGDLAGFDLPGWPVPQSADIVGERGAILLYPDAASTFDDPGVVVVFDIPSASIERVYDGYGGQGVRLSPDGALLAGQPFNAPGILGPVHIRDVESGEIVAVLEDLCSFDTELQIPGPDCAATPDPRGDSLYWADFSPEGSMIAVGGGDEGIAGVWDVASGQRLAWLTAGALLGNDGVVVEFNPESDRLLLSTAELTVYATEDWSEVATWPVGWAFLDLHFTPDGRHIVASDTTLGIVTVDTETWELVGEPLPGHTGGSRAIDVNSDGSLIASGASDGLVRVSNLATGELIQAFSIGNTTITVVEFVDDQHLLVIGQGGPAVVMTIDLPELIEIASSQVTRAPTPDECATYHIDPCPTLAQIRSDA